MRRWRKNHKTIENCIKIYGVWQHKNIYYKLCNNAVATAAAILIGNMKAKKFKKEKIFLRQEKIIKFKFKMKIVAKKQTKVCI